MDDLEEDGELPLFGGTCGWVGVGCSKDSFLEEAPGKAVWGKGEQVSHNSIA